MSQILFLGFNVHYFIQFWQEPYEGSTIFISPNLNLRKLRLRMSYFKHLVRCGSRFSEFYSFFITTIHMVIQLYFSLIICIAIKYIWMTHWLSWKLMVQFMYYLSVKLIHVHGIRTLKKKQFLNIVNALKSNICFKFHIGIY